MNKLIGYKYVIPKMKELILCFTQQDLNEFPWAITLEEFQTLKKIAALTEKIPGGKGE